MPLKVTHFGAPTDPAAAGNVAALNKWADYIEQHLRAQQKQVFQIAKQTSLTATGGVTSVGFSGPKESVITGSPITSSGTIGWSWAGEIPGTFFGAPPNGLGGFQALSQSKLVIPSGTATLATTATPSSSPSFGLYVATANNTMPVIGGTWTTLVSGDFVVGYSALTGTTPVTLSFPGLGVGTYLAALSLFTGPLPTVVQTKNGGGSNSGTVAFSSNNTAGNTLIVTLGGFSFQTAGFSIVISDTNGNSYQQISSQFNSPTGQPESGQAIFIATNCSSGANTVTFSFNAGAGTTTTNVTIMELGPLPAGSNIPLFRPIAAADLPPINIGTTGNGGVSGVLKVANGGTGANLSATGGAGQVVQQTSVGGAFTVGTLQSLALFRVTNQSSNYTAVAGDFVVCNTSSGGFTVTLPAASASNALIIQAKKVSNDNNLVTIAAAGTDKIDGASTASFLSQYTSLSLISDGVSNWYIF